MNKDTLPERVTTGEAGVVEVHGWPWAPIYERYYAHVGEIKDHFLKARRAYNDHED